MRLPSENSLGPEEDEGEVKPENSHVLEDRGYVEAAECFDDANEKRRHQSSRNTAEAAHGHTDKSDQAEHCADFRVHGEVGGHDAAGDADDGPADAEDQEIDPLGVDAHQLGSLLVQGRGLDSPAEARAFGHAVDQAHDDQRQNGRYQLGNGYDQEAQLKSLISQPSAGEDAKIGTELVQAEIFEEHGQTEGGQERRKRWFADGIADDQPVGHGSQHEDENAAGNHRDKGVHV